MRENRPSGLEGGEGQLNGPPLPLSLGKNRILKNSATAPFGGLFAKRSRRGRSGVLPGTLPCACQHGERQPHEGTDRGVRKELPCPTVDQVAETAEYGSVERTACRAQKRISPSSSNQRLRPHGLGCRRAHTHSPRLTGFAQAGDSPQGRPWNPLQKGRVRAPCPCLAIGTALPEPYGLESKGRARPDNMP